LERDHVAIHVKKKTAWLVAIAYQMIYLMPDASAGVPAPALA
jgi:hypothetical protein